MGQSMALSLSHAVQDAHTQRVLSHPTLRERGVFFESSEEPLEHFFVRLDVSPSKCTYSFGWQATWLAVDLIPLSMYSLLRSSMFMPTHFANLCPLPFISSTHGVPNGNVRRAFASPLAA